MLLTIFPPNCTFSSRCFRELLKSANCQCYWSGLNVSLVACLFPQLFVGPWGTGRVSDQPLEQRLTFLESSGTMAFFLLVLYLVSVLNLARFTILNLFLTLMAF